MLRGIDASCAADCCGSAEHIDPAGTYLTNGVFLYRVVDVVATAAGGMADIEDCYRLDTVRVPVRELLARRLRVVRLA